MVFNLRSRTSGALPAHYLPFIPALSTFSPFATCPISPGDATHGQSQPQGLTLLVILHLPLLSSFPLFLYISYHEGKAQHIAPC